MKKIYAFLFSLFVLLNLPAQTLYFPPTSGSAWDTISPQSLNYCQPRIDSLYAYLDSNKTKAFLLLKDGKIVLEKYFGTHTQNSPWQWASAGKTITSFMVGIAQQEHHLSIYDSTSKYLGVGWTNCTPGQESKITVRHQLTMSSGLDDGVPDNSCTLDSCLLYKADAGTRWAYHNAPYTLLDSVIQSATGVSLNTYTTQKLKTPTGMTGTFLSLDYNNVYYSNARSMARFGLLILNKGNWNGTQIMTDTGYCNQMVNTSQSLNLSYGYLWWLNGKASYHIPQTQVQFPGPLAPNAPADMIAAMGKDGQFLNVVSSQNLVMVRMGESPDGLPVPFLLNDGIWDYINKLQCNITSVGTELSDNPVLLYPNPTINQLNISNAGAFQTGTISIYDLHGRLVQQLKYTPQLDVSALSAGMYVLEVQGDNGVARRKFIKE